MRINGIKRLVWVISIVGLMAFIVAAATGPIVWLGIVGWGIFNLGMVVLVPIYRMQALRKRASGEEAPSGRFSWVKHETVGPVGWTLLGAGLVVYLVSSLSGLPTELSFAGWLSAVIGLLVLIVLTWRRQSGL